MVGMSGRCEATLRTVDGQRARLSILLAYDAGDGIDAMPVLVVSEVEGASTDVSCPQMLSFR